MKFRAFSRVPPFPLSLAQAYERCCLLLQEGRDNTVLALPDHCIERRQRLVALLL